MGFVVVTGLPGAGKTTLGRAVAAALDRPFPDKDDVLEELFDGASDPSPRSVLSRQADSIFRRARHGAPGGGAGVVLAATGAVDDVGHPDDVARRGARPGRALVPLPARGRPSPLPRPAPPPGHGDDGRSSDGLLEQFEALAALGPVGVGRLVSVDTDVDVDVPGLVRRLCDADDDERRAPGVSDDGPVGDRPGDAGGPVGGTTRRHDRGGGRS